MGFYPTPRKPRRKGDIRWLRSDGTPNFSDRIHRETGDMEILAKKPAVAVTPTTPVGRAVETMAESHRSLVVAQNNYLKGLLLATHVINYLGGGDYFKIVENRHGYNVYSAYYKEFVESIMESNPITAYVDEKLSSVLEKMVLHGVGILSVVDRNGRVYGVVSEHDLVTYLYGLVKIGVPVSKIMSTPVVSIEAGSTVKHAMETMIKYGFRRLPVVDGERVVGIVTAMDLIKFFNPKTLLKRIASEDLREALAWSVREVMSENLVTVKPTDDLSTAVNAMLENNVSSVLVVGDDMKLIGIVTERDVLYALTARSV